MYFVGIPRLRDSYFDRLIIRSDDRSSLMRIMTLQQVSLLLMISGIVARGAMSFKLYEAYNYTLAKDMAWPDLRALSL